MCQPPYQVEALVMAKLYVTLPVALGRIRSMGLRIQIHKIWYIRVPRIGLCHILDFRPLIGSQEADRALIGCGFPVKNLSSQLTHWELTLKLMVG